MGTLSTATVAAIAIIVAEVAIIVAADAVAAGQTVHVACPAVPCYAVGFDTVPERYDYPGI